MRPTRNELTYKQTPTWPCPNNDGKFGSRSAPKTELHTSNIRRNLVGHLIASSRQPASRNAIQARGVERFFRFDSEALRAALFEPDLPTANRASKDNSAMIANRRDTVTPQEQANQQ